MTEQSVAQQTGQVKLHCPHCKSHNIMITTESSVNGALTSNHGAFSATTVSNTHRNYWMCADCGTKFRNIQNLEEEIAKGKNNPTIFAIISGIGFIISLYLWINALSSLFGFLLMSYAIAFTIATIVTFCFIFVSKKKTEQLNQELAYLKENCFN